MTTPFGSMMVRRVFERGRMFFQRVEQVKILVLKNVVMLNVLMSCFADVVELVFELSDAVLFFAIELVNENRNGKNMLNTAKKLRKMRRRYVR
jgi:hypothetical protein